MKNVIKILFIIVSGFMIMIGGGVKNIHAAQFTIIDDNSSATINTDSQFGMSSWSVDATDHLFQQWFWYRVGDEVPGGPLNPEKSIDTLTFNAAGSGVTDTGNPFDPSWDSNPDTLHLSYTSTSFDLAITYSLDGGAWGSNASDISETIKVINNSGESLDFHFFQYTDFHLGGTFDDDTAYITDSINPNTIIQSDPLTVFSETVVLPIPDNWEIAEFSQIRDKLTDTDADDLSNTNTPLENVDITWAFQWDLTIDPNSSILITKDKRIEAAAVPEPATMLLLGIGLIGLAGVGIRRKVDEKKE